MSHKLFRRHCWWIDFSTKPLSAAIGFDGRDWWRRDPKVLQRHRQDERGRRLLCTQRSQPIRPAVTRILDYDEHNGKGVEDFRKQSTEGNLWTSICPSTFARVVGEGDVCNYTGIDEPATSSWLYKKPKWPSKIGLRTEITRKNNTSVRRGGRRVEKDFSVLGVG